MTSSPRLSRPTASLGGRQAGLWRLALLAALLAAAVPAVAQQILEAPDVVHRHARTGYPTIYVYVWGAADLPGIWEVEETVELVELLTAARPRGVGEGQPGVEQTVSVRLYRQPAASPSAPPGRAAAGRTLIYETPLEALLASAGTVPGLADGDVVSVEIERRRPVDWRDIGGIVGAASAVVLLILRIATL